MSDQDTMTRQREKEEGFLRLLSFYDSILQSIGSGVFTADAQGRLTSFNRASEAMTGRDLGWALGRQWWEAFGWSDLESLGIQGEEVNRPLRFEAKGTAADGRALIVGMTLNPLVDGGIRVGLVGIFKDLTQVRRMEAEAQRREWLARLGEMSAGMAHEIRNPLAALAGAMQLLRRDVGGDEQSARLMDIVVQEAKRLDRIITEFLRFARPPALAPVVCNLNHILAETLELLALECLPSSPVRIETCLSKEPLLAQADADQLKQVFWNLGLNAVQAMPQGGMLTVSSRLRPACQMGDQDRVEIAFQDTGRGIQSDHLEKIFLPFFTTKSAGSGIGLAAVHRIIDLHGGGIQVSSEEGQGARFVITMPAAGGVVVGCGTAEIHRGGL